MGLGTVAGVELCAGGAESSAMGLGIVTGVELCAGGAGSSAMGLGIVKMCMASVSSCAGSSCVASSIGAIGVVGICAIGLDKGRKGALCSRVVDSVSVEDVSCSFVSSSVFCATVGGIDSGRCSAGSDIIFSSTAEGIGGKDGGV